MEIKEYDGKYSGTDIKKVLEILSNLMCKKDVDKMLSSLNTKTNGIHNAAMNKAYFLFEQVMDDPDNNRHIKW